MMSNRERIERDQRFIIELIDASWEAAEKKGTHPLEPGCSCIMCINKRKKLMDEDKPEHKYTL